MIKNKKGFTLVEVIVVLVILAILAAVMIPTFTGYIDRANAGKEVSNARYLATAAVAANAEWYAKGRPGNSDAAYKINIEQLILDYISDDIATGMVSHEKNKPIIENVVQVGFSPIGGQWNRFINEAKTKSYKNYFLVFMHKNADNSRKVDPVIDAVYYISANGKYSVKIVFSEGTVHGATGLEWKEI